MAVTYHVEDEKGRATVELEPDGALWRLRVDGAEMLADVQQVNPDCLSVLIDGRSYKVHFLEAPGRTVVCVRGEYYEFAVADEREHALREAAGANNPEAAGSGLVRSRIPGKVIAVDVAPGQTVARGERLLVLEAMKMENEVRAEASGVVAQILVQPGETVESGAPMIRIETAEGGKSEP